MSLIRLDNISIEFGDVPLLVDTSIAIEADERICLLGRNGAGKTTLLNILNGSLEPDSGLVHRKQNLRVSKLEQALPHPVDTPVFEVVRSGLAEQSALIERFHQLSRKIDSETVSAAEHSADLDQLAKLQAAIDAGGGWNLDNQVEKYITQLELPASRSLASLSGGWRRRVALCKALVGEPDLLLLDEPTNHLDISTIEWLEHVVRGYRGSVVFITHDRDFLQKLATRIIEIDRGKMIDWPGNYRKFLRLKEQSNREEDQQNALFDKKLAQEEAWIREGIKARRTRNEGRVRALEKMREERGQRIKRQGKASIQIATAEASGRKVCELRNITHAYDGETLFNKLKLKIMRGDRIGLIGNNGVGKSTLLKIILGQVEPDEGTVKLGTNLQIAYFDQVKRDLDEEKTIAENVGRGREYINVNGHQRHVIGYLKNFLFSPKRAMTPVKALSGGEKNRVSLARMFTLSSNLLVLDEPTNDLDIEMLEVLEQRLVEYEGTLLIVSHDREFLDNVVTSILVFEQESGVQEYVGGFSDWSRRGRKLKLGEEQLENTKPSVALDTSQTLPMQRKPKKLSYKLQHELDNLPDAIEALENTLSQLQQKISEPEFYDRDFSITRPVLDELERTRKQLDVAIERWEKLEDMQTGSSKL
ncbi:MAG: ATP-binding cassette domain-containing protein [Gammaproteobacteria bacterium]|nr:ATP-binding cassette domain-containing protein [Gammaproteobacteria bacterium]MBT8151979.1 ATP-binding cassette domain-containing protein [Gammaproteobacteria bacterium]NND38911.1 ATP-binding cassette domain-containing protein [Pseudomonadales bacterium]NNM12384.1 ATP-binding cassette domain-containing protein [Pseudomonadales bacterium]RZV55673.1 MAG: ATP-binding cassette domain-containing protein [Pseudomonadales bacterium]